MLERMEIVRVASDAEGTIVDAWAAMRAELWPEWDGSEVWADAARMVRSEMFRTGEEVAFLAYEVGEAIGFAEARLRRDPVNGCVTSPVAFLEGILVREPWRRHGVARALFGAVEARGGGAGGVGNRIGRAVGERGLAPDACGARVCGDGAGGVLPTYFLTAMSEA